MSRLRLIIPFLMLAAAALACDPPYYDPPHVQHLWADDDRVYALAGNLDDAGVYQTTDAGATWQPAPPDTPIPGEPIRTLTITRRDDTYYGDDGALWTFPRPVFRFFFLDDPDGQYFDLPYLPSNIIVGDTLYLAMGTEGVVVGPAPGSGSTQSWRLSSVGIDRLNPLPLTITDPGQVAGIVALGLLVPPLALLHAYALSRPLRYVLAPRPAWTRALILTGILTGLAAVAIVIWLTDIRTDYYDIVSVMTAIVAVSGAGLTWHAARRAGVSATAQRRLTLAGGLVSLIVPGGVAAIWAAWWAVFILLIGFLCLRLPFLRALRRAGIAPVATRQRTLIDWLGFSTLLIAAIMGIVLVLLVLYLPLPYQVRDIVNWILLLAGVIGIAVVVYRISVGRVEGAIAAQVQTVPPDAIRLFRREMIAAVIAAAVLIGAASIGTFAMQASAYDWFTSLLHP